VPTTQQVLAVLHERCAPCHSLQPTEPGFDAPPAGVVLTDASDVERLAPLIDQEAVQSHAMPPGNVTHITQAERNLLARWLASR
jgi:uncharacterized membrane protein